MLECESGAAWRGVAWRGGRSAGGGGERRTDASVSPESCALLSSVAIFSSHTNTHFMPLLLLEVHEVIKCVLIHH